MVRNNTTTNKPHFLTFNPPPPPSSRDEFHEEEFDESDVVWSSSSPSPSPTPAPDQTTSLSTPFHPSTLPLPGLTAALFSPESPKSPTSIQRKTTSSPVSMIPSSISRTSDGGPVVGSYYGRRFHQSAPVNVPVWPTRSGPRRGLGLGRFDEMDYGGEDEGFFDDGEMVPPHEIVARSQKTTTFSVIEGAGRTLKGRDLTTVRNAVFQKTGFLQ